MSSFKAFSRIPGLFYDFYVYTQNGWSLKKKKTFLSFKRYNDPIFSTKEKQITSLSNIRIEFKLESQQSSASFNLHSVLCLLHVCLGCHDLQNSRHARENQRSANIWTHTFDHTWYPPKIEHTRTSKRVFFYGDRKVAELFNCIIIGRGGILISYSSLKSLLAFKTILKKF